MSIDEPQKNKMMQAAPAKKAFIFPGDGIWHPERIEAATVAEAETIYHKIKKLIVPELSTPEAATTQEGVQ